MRNLGNVAIHPNVAFAGQFLDARAAELRNALREKQIQPPPGSPDTAVRVWGLVAQASACGFLFEASNVMKAWPD